MFWSEQHGAFSDWVDSAGKRRDYFYTWHNLNAVTSGAANASQAASIMSSLRSERARLAAAFNVTVADIFCTPSNTRVADPDDILYCNKGGVSRIFNGSTLLSCRVPCLDQQGIARLTLGTQDFPFYENGDCFLLMTGWEKDVATGSRFREPFSPHSLSSFFESCLSNSSPRMHGELACWVATRFIFINTTLPPRPRQGGRWRPSGRSARLTQPSQC